MRYLGIDYGEKRIGLALSDEDGMLAFPYGILQNDASVLTNIENICATEGVSAVVIGESLTYAGAENPVMKKIFAFKDALRERTKLPVFLMSETLTSSQAKRVHENKKEQNRDRKIKKKNQKHMDDSAAAIILQSYIDTHNGARKHGNI